MEQKKEKIKSRHLMIHAETYLHIHPQSYLTKNYRPCVQSTVKWICTNFHFFFTFEVLDFLIQKCLGKIETVNCIHITDRYNTLSSGI